MEDFIGDMLARIDASGENFSSQAYQRVADELGPLLNVMLIGYVAYYGLQLIMGTAQVSVSTVVSRIVRMVVIVLLIQNWGTFDQLFYSWISTTPEDIGRAILTMTGSGITEPTNGLSLIWRTAAEAADAFARRSGYLTILPSMIGAIIMMAIGIFIAIALAVLVLAKLMMWLLIGVAPIFIACFMFDSTRQWGQSWFSQVITYAIIPLFVFSVCGFLIAALDPEIASVRAAADATTINLGDIGGFLLLAFGGAFVLFNIQSLAQGISGSITAGVGNSAQRAIGRISGWGARGGSLAANSAWSGMKANADRLDRFSGELGRSSSANAMTMAIQNNSKIRS